VCVVHVQTKGKKSGQSGNRTTEKLQREAKAHVYLSFVSVARCKDRGLCDWPITYRRESCRMCVTECD
jgi:hypothetical protein